MKKFFSNKIFLSGLFLLVAGIATWSVRGTSQPAPATQGEIKTREEGPYVYYDVILDRAKPAMVEVNAKDGKILISGLLAFQNKVDGQTQGFFSRFEKSVLVPDNMSYTGYQVDHGRGKIILKFVKSGNS